MRGDVHTYKPRNAKGHEQQGQRYCVLVSSDDLLLSTVLVCPTSASARPTGFRPEIEIDGKTTYVLLELLTRIDRDRLGNKVGTVRLGQLRQLNEALLMVLPRLKRRSSNDSPHSKSRSLGRRSVPAQSDGSRGKSQP